LGISKTTASERRKALRRSDAQLAASEIPRTDELKTCRFQVRQVPGRQTPAVDARNGRDHSVPRGQGSALSQCCTHHLAVGERGGFRKVEDSAPAASDAASRLSIT
jgi:hypothetical protein